MIKPINDVYFGYNRFLIIGKSQDEVDKELHDFINEKGTEEYSYRVCKNRVKPNKDTLRPEYSYEVYRWYIPKQLRKLVKEMDDRDD